MRLHHLRSGTLIRLNDRENCTSLLRQGYHIIMAVPCMMLKIHGQDAARSITAITAAKGPRGVQRRLQILNNAGIPPQ